jgi:hypothetical protein
LAAECRNGGALLPRRIVPLGAFGLQHPSLGACQRVTDGFEAGAIVLRQVTGRRRHQLG